MITTEPNVNSLFSSTKRYRVPLYQRDYVWNDRNWEDLWEAITEKSDLRLEDENNAKSHFTGAIVIQDDAGNLEIIDGQQRLTTFQIIFCAIRDICKKFDEDPAGIVRRTKRFTENRGSSTSVLLERYKLLPREGRDRNAFQTLIQLEEMETKRKVSKGPIHRAYGHFTKAIENYIGKDYNKLDKLFTTIKEDFILVQIIVDQDDDPEKIFQTINGTGQALDEFDLLRNNLFLRAGSGTKRDKLYENHWEHFDREGFWRQGGVRDEFLWHFLKAKRGAHFKGKQKLFDQYQMYCKELGKKQTLSKDENPVEYEFAELSRYAEVYKEMHDPNSDDIGQRMEFYKKFNSEFNLTLQSLKSFVLYITNELGRPSSERKLVFDLLESYAVRWILCTGLTAPATEINSLFLDVLDRKKSFNVFDLLYLLSKESKNDQEVDSIFRKLLPNFNKFPIGSSSKKSRKNKNSRIEKLGKYISDRLKSHPNNLKPDELRACFCEIWPSSEILLQSCLKDGLPIVYSQLPISEKVKDQLEPYIFVTYNGTKKLSKYKTQQGKMVGIDEDCDSNEKFELHIEEILFAFPAIAMSGLQPSLKNNRDDVKDLTLMSVEKEKAYQVKHWLRLYTHAAENSHSKHWLLPDIDATAVTRAGHVLHGTLKSFTDEAIHMQISDQLVIVYMHGLYELNTTAMLHTSPRMFMTYDGMIELVNHETRGNKIIGSEGKKKVILDNKEILFDFPMSSTRVLQPYLNNIRDDVKNQGLTSLSKQETLKFKRKYLNFTGQSKVEIVTRAGHVLQGTIKTFDKKDAILVKISGKRVKVFWHGLYDLKVEPKVKTKRSSQSGSENKMPWQLMIESKKNQPIRFMCNEGIIELSEITKSTRTKITGSYENEDRIEIQTQDVLFAYYSARGKSSDVSRRKIWTKVETPKTQQVEQLSIILKSVNQSNNKFSLKIVTLAGHVLQGRPKSHDKDAIYMDIGRRKVIVFRHGLSAISLITSGDSMLVSESFKFITYDGPIELSQIETGPYELTGIDKSGEQLPPLKKLNILFAYPIKAAPNIEPTEIDDQVNDQTLGQSQKDRFQIETSHLESAMAEKIGIRILTRRGHVLEGTIEHYDKYEIHLQIKGQTVIVYKHGLYEISTEAEGIVSNYGNEEN